MTGEDIEMKMRTMVTDVRKASWETSFLGEGRFFDASEIEETYKNKPNQKAAIYKNALKMWHPDRQCDVWRIRDFKTSDLEKSSQERTLKRRGEGEDTCKQK